MAAKSILKISKMRRRYE